jgi:hypothetical protein
LQEHWQITEEHAPDARWVIAARNPENRGIVIAQPSNVPDQVIIQGQVDIDDVHQKQFMAMSFEDRQTFLWNLRFELLRMQIDFNGISDPLKSVIVTQPVYFDALRKDTFLRRVREIRNGVIAIQWSVQRRFADALPAEDVTGFSVN